MAGPTAVLRANTTLFLGRTGTNNIRANARVLYSLVNLLFSATGVPVPTYLLDSQSELVPFTGCRRVFGQDLQKLFSKRPEPARFGIPAWRLLT